MQPFHVILQSTSSWPCSFEEAVAALELLPGMFIELDGSFVWRLQEDATAWQLDGCLFDRAGQLLYAELKGTCAAHPFAQFLACLKADQASLAVQLVREAQTISLAEFQDRYL